MGRSSLALILSGAAGSLVLYWLSIGLAAPRQEGWGARVALRGAARPWLTGLALGAGLAAGAGAGVLLMHAVRFSAGRRAVADLAGWSLGYLVIAAAQELALRGWLLWRLQRAFGDWAAAAITSGVFVAIHLWRPGESIAGGCGLFLLGLLLALGVLRTGSVWWAAGLHGGWNIVQALGLGFADAGAKPVAGVLLARTQGAALLSGGGTGLEGSLAGLLVLAAATTVLGLRLRTQSLAASR